MSPSRPSRSRVVLPAAAGALALAAALAGCAPGRTVAGTVDEWSGERFVAASDARAAGRRAARILDIADAPLQVPAVLQVGAPCTVAFERPDPFARPVASLPEGIAVRVEEKSAFMRRPPGAAIDGGLPDDPFPTWVRVSGGSVSGWVPARSLVDPMLRARGADALVESLLATVAKPGSAMPRVDLKATPRRAGSDYAAADALLAVAALPPRFRPSSDDVFAWGGRNDRLPPAGLPIDRLDSECAAQARAVRDEAAEVPPATFYPKAPGDLWGAITIGLGPKAGVALAIDELVTIFMARHPISAVEERALGRECLAALLAGRRTLPLDHPVSAYVNWAGTRLAAASSAPFPASGTLFAVLDDAAPVLAAVPGGPILVSTGMLGSLANEHELAAVLACGVAHVEERHGVLAAMDAGGGELSAVLQVHALDAAGALDSVIAAGLQEIPEDYLDDAMKRTRTALLARVADRFDSIVSATVAAASTPSPEHRLAAELRAVALVAACGWSPDAVRTACAGSRASSGGSDRARDELLRAAAAAVTAGSGRPTPQAVPGARWRRFESLRGAPRRVHSGKAIQT